MDEIKAEPSVYFNGVLSDASEHLAMLDNPAANRRADEAAVLAAIEIGMSEDEARALLIGPDPVAAIRERALRGRPLTNNSTETDDLEIGAETKMDLDIKERHVDFLLHEEMSVCPAFLSNFIRSAALNFTERRLSEEDETHPSALSIAANSPQTTFELQTIRRSVSDNYGEADLIVLFHIGGRSGRFALLIEDKVNAPFQDQQAARYEKRGEAGIRDGSWDAFLTCLVASASYIDRGHDFDSAVALESIRPWFTSADPGRANYKLGQIDKAILKASISGVKEVDAVVTSFRKSHYEAYRFFFSDMIESLYLCPPKENYNGETWFKIFNRRDLPKGAYVNHKAPWGFVDLTFPDTDAEVLKSRLDFNLVLEDKMSIVKTSKSTAIRLAVAKIEDFRSFEAHEKTVLEAFGATRRLFNFYCRSRMYLDPALLAANTKIAK